MSSYLWQNFLTSSKARHYIADKIKQLYLQNNCEALVEIWPGKWAITKHIFDTSKKFFVVEKDNKLLPRLKQNTNISDEHIISMDVLQRDIVAFLKQQKLLSEKTMVVWNLPYYITSPILRYFFSGNSLQFAGGIFLVQYEVGAKLDINSTKKSYLWRILNHSYEVSYLKQVPAKAFTPAPKIKSAVIKLTPLKISRNIDFENMMNFIDQFSGFSRKTLGKITKILKKKWIENYSIPIEFQKRRLEELNFDDVEKILLD